MAKRNEYSLLLLAGGKSCRMGANKAELLYAGKTFLAHTLEKARALGIEQCYISGYAAEQQDVQTVWDQYPDRGPLGGIHACMQAMTTPYCLVLPVDAPTLPLDILEGLLAAHERQADKARVLIWEHDDRQEPLIAVYPVAMAQTIGELIAEKAVPVFRALDRWGYECCRLEMPEQPSNEQIINVNTPEAYQKLIGHNQ